MEGQRKAATSSKVPKRRVRQEFIAAVRYADGRSELVRVRNADDISDARSLVLAELVDVSSVVVAHRH